jgi:hypothetical protein
MAYIYALSDTWNAAGTTFTGIGLNVTDSASAAGSLLLDLRVGGTSLFNVAKNGRLATDNITSAGAYYLTLPNAISTAGYWASATDGALGINGAGFVLAANREFAWSGTSSNPNVAVDLRLARDAANTLAQRNGTNAQTFRAYNTFTDASNYERGVFDWTTQSNSLTIGTQQAGSGIARSLRLITQGDGNLLFITNSVTRFDVSSLGLRATANLIWTADNTYDIGASGATRPRNLYMGSWIRMATTTVASLPAAATAGAGARMFVTDALVPVFGSAVAGGGAVTVPVYSTGSAWNVG